MEWVVLASMIVVEIPVREWSHCNPDGITRIYAKTTMILCTAVCNWILQGKDELDAWWIEVVLFSGDLGSRWFGNPDPDPPTF